jgi:prepilin signal peptidase PulO-like enzyme (type II secretory pathway)
VELLDIFLVLTGLLAGSLIAAGADAYASGGRKESLLKPRCASCGQALRWYRRLPVIGWVVSRGRCHKCGRPSGAHEPIAALGGAGIVAASLAFAPAGTLFFTILLGWLLLALALIDLRMFILPDRLNLAVFALGAVMVALTRPEVWVDHAAGAVVGYGALFSIEVLYRRLRGRDGLGRGDAKLFGALGVWLGWAGLAPAMLIASLSGILATLISALVRREPVGSGSVLAFGPWIALGGWVVWLSGYVATVYTPAG